jgi:hypothetical protein
MPRIEFFGYFGILDSLYSSKFNEICVKVGDRWDGTSEASLSKSRLYMDIEDDDDDSSTSSILMIFFHSISSLFFSVKDLSISSSLSFFGHLIRSWYLGFNQHLLLTEFPGK